jgi:hypothetical protein
MVMRLMKRDGLSSTATDSKRAVILQVLLRRIVRALLNSEDPEARLEFVTKYIDIYDDIRYYTYVALWLVYALWFLVGGFFFCFLIFSIELLLRLLLTAV